MENEKKQPIRKVTSWHLKVEYIDATGEVYSKGKPTGTKVEQTEEDLGWLATNGYDKEGNVLTMTGAAATPNPEVQNKKSKEEELSARVDELQSLLNKFLSKPQGGEGIIINAKEEEKFGTIKAKDMPADDFDEEETTFIQRGRGGLVSVYYTKEKKQVLAPYKQPILFVYTYTDDQRRGNDDNIIHYAIFKTHSKSEKKFIRESPFYNISIFESVLKATKYDMATAAKMSNLAVWIESLSPDQVYGEASSRGITLQGKTMEELKRIIMLARFDELSKEGERQQENRVAQMNDIFEK